jgi:hypothetical protein
MRIGISTSLSSDFKESERVAMIMVAISKWQRRYRLSQIPLQDAMFGGYLTRPAISAVATAFVMFLWAAAMPAFAQNLVTIKPGPKATAWWLRADFHARDTAIRGIPVEEIRADWCKASEFTREKFPPNTLVENGTDLMKEANLSFSLEGAFDGTGLKQTALVGTYETCTGEKGRFFLIFDSATRKIRFLDAEPTKDRFSAIGTDGRKIVIMYCFECDLGSTVRWDKARKRFLMR